MQKRDYKDYTVILPVTPADFKRVEMMHPRMVHYLPAKKVCFVGSAEVGKLLKKEKESGVYGPEDVDRVFFINENDVISFEDVHRVRTELLAGDTSARATGWFYQQFIKMSYSYLCEDEYYMEWDGDTVPCGRFSMFSNDENETLKTPYFDVKQEYHEPYFVTMERLVPGLHKVIGHSFVSEHMLFRKDLMQQLIAKIESNENIPGKFYWEKILRCLTPEELQTNSFAEFETYGTYVALTNPSAYRLREWHSFRYAGDFFDPNDISERDFNWLGRDFLAVSFEKGSKLNAETKNLFNNPYYQERMSARQMFRIVQEETRATLHDVWWDEDSPVFSDDQEEEELTEFVPFYPGMDAASEKEYKIFFDMAEQYVIKNPDLAWLSYENAMFLCADSGMRDLIGNKMRELEQSDRMRVKKTAIILMTHNQKKTLEQCLNHIYLHCAPSAYRIIVIDNASGDGTAEWLQGCDYDLDLLVSDRVLTRAEGYNTGIQYSDPGEDVLFLDVNTYLTHNALFRLRMALYDHAGVGAVGAMSNRCDLLQRESIFFSKQSEYMKYAVAKNANMARPYEEKSKLDGFALLIRGRVPDLVGGLDENFKDDKYVFTDYSTSMRAAGFQLLVCHNAFVYQKKSAEAGTGNLCADREQYADKWGFDDVSYADIPDDEIKALYDFAQNAKDYFRVLELGSGTGNFLTAVKNMFPNAMVTGIEDQERVIHSVIESVPVLYLDWRHTPLPFASEYFDYIVIRDAQSESIDAGLESVIRKHLKENGKLYLCTE